MCPPSAPKPPEEDKRPPRFMLSRDQHERLQRNQPSAGNPNIMLPPPGSSGGGGSVGGADRRNITAAGGGPGRSLSGGLALS